MMFLSVLRSQLENSLFICLYFLPVLLTCGWCLIAAEWNPGGFVSIKSRSERWWCPVPELPGSFSSSPCTHSFTGTKAMPVTIQKPLIFSWKYQLWPHNRKAAIGCPRGPWHSPRNHHLKSRQDSPSHHPTTLPEPPSPCSPPPNDPYFLISAAERRGFD